MKTAPAPKTTIAGKTVTVHALRRTGSYLPCPGEAHVNGMQDHCMVCLGHSWGFIPAFAPVNLESARAAGEVVRVSDLSDDQLTAIESDSAARLVDGETKTKSMTTLQSFVVWG